MGATGSGGGGVEGKRVIVSENACTFHNSFWVTGPGCRLGSLMFCLSTG